MTEIFFFKSNQCINSFNLALANVQREIECLNVTVENVAQSIDYSFNELKLVIDKRREELLKNLCKIKDGKTKLLSDQVHLIMNEKHKVEFECKEYHKSISNIECKRLGSQIQQINEKLDCLRSLCEPRENCFINYEYKHNNVIENVDGVLTNFGKFRTSSTYPPLCYANIRDLNNENSSLTSSTIAPSSIASLSFPANLAVSIQIQTVDYYGKKRTEGIFI
jgi:tripartite motif-containing protein 2/3